ncbi:MAG: monovalent cation/H(+) antiporter subunit G [Pseudomonadota bacterium]
MDVLALLADILSWPLLLAGSFFYLVGKIGLIRMPDLFTRMHAVSVSETLGLGLLLLGLLLQAGFSLVAFKLLVTFALLFVAAPVTSHALARAALHDGQRPLLSNAEGRLEPTDPVTRFPALAERLGQPVPSQSLEDLPPTAPEATPSNS